MKLKVDYNANLDLPDWLVEELAGNQLLAKLLFRRGIDTPEKLADFLYPESYSPTTPAEFPNLKEAVNLLVAAVKQDKKICVYGDYDVDGVTSTTILVTMLREIGAEVQYHIPNRFTEGYGLDQEVIKDLATQEVDLILTCDCGISNQEEITLAKELGLEVVVTDHHQLPAELPKADTILAPKLLPADHQAYDLPGAGMAYFLAQAVLEREDKPKKAAQLIDPLALAIVADVVPLQGENRYLLQQGLDSLATTAWVGIQELCRVCDLEPFNLSEEEIGFQLGPRINATGRIDTASKAVELLLSSDRQEAKDLAKELDEINRRRKEISNQMAEEALSLVEDKNDLESIILYQPNWHQGIVGIVAGRLVEKFNVPALLMTLTEDGETVTGSARSIDGIHINNALKKCAEFLASYGGHAGAAGFSLAKEDLADFKAKLTKVLTTEKKELGSVREIEVDDKLSLKDLSLEVYEELRQLAPFGEKNPEPIFYSSAVDVVSTRSFSEGQHLNLTLDDGTDRHSAVWWRAEPEKLGDQVDLVYSLGVNEWRGRRELQLVIEEVIQQTGDLTEEIIACQLEDWRNWRELGDSLPQFTEAIYYYEGVKDYSYQVINRYQGEKANTLVLLSCPPELKVFQDLIRKIEPQKIILAYSETELESTQQFIKKLMGLVKNVINKHQGETDIYRLASLTAQKEATVVLGLKLLQAKGLIEVDFIARANLVLKKGVKQVSDRQYQKRLQALVAESKAFRKYMLQKDLAQIEEILFNSR
ncbi:single-stranded-DNA-specific exonuclease RecJ [Halanaerobaculum tunisiense]